MIKQDIIFKYSVLDGIDGPIARLSKQSESVPEDNYGRLKDAIGSTIPTIGKFQ